MAAATALATVGAHTAVRLAKECAEDGIYNIRRDTYELWARSGTAQAMFDRTMADLDTMHQRSVEYTLKHIVSYVT